MRIIRGTLLAALLVLTPSCGKSGGSSSGGPPPPSGPNITGPASPLPAAYWNIPVAPTSFTGTGTGTLAWTVTAGSLPPGVSLLLNGTYSGTPTSAGSYTFTVRLTDSNGTDSKVYAQVVLASVFEIETNNAPADADALPPGIPGIGNLGANDVDFWSFDGTANQVIEVEVFGVRMDHLTWDFNATLPKLSIIGPDGSSFLLGHDAFLVPDPGVIAGWQWGLHDLDIPRFRIPQSGTYYLRLEPDVFGATGGLYAVKVNVFYSGAIQAESEANNSPATADAIVPGAIWGVRVDGDDDYFSFTISAPTIVAFVITAYRNGVSGVGGSPDDDYFDPRLALIDSDQSTFLAINDDAWFFYDSAIHYLITTPGTYYLGVTETSYGCAGDGEYFLTFTQVPVGSDAESEGNNSAATADPIAYGDVVSGMCTTSAMDLDYFSFSGSAGDVVRVHWFDGGNHQGAPDIVNVTITIDDTIPITAVFNRADNASQTGLNCLRGILPATGTYYVVVFGVTSDTPYAFELVRFNEAAFESESNNTPGTADALPGSGRVGGVIGSFSDLDVFSFTVQDAEVVTFSIYAGPASQSDGFASFSNYGSDLLPDLEILNASGGVLKTTQYSGALLSGESITNGLATSEITFLAPVAGTYFVRVSDSNGTGGADHLYRLEKR